MITSRNFCLILCIIATVTVMLFCVWIRFSNGPKSYDVSNPNPRCEWVFLEYISSQWEQLWETHIDKWADRPCAQYVEQQENAKIWVKYSTSTSRRRPKTDPSTDVFSYFRYKRSCDDKERRLYIEPFALITRHPYSCAPRPVKSLSYIPNKDYIVIDWKTKEQHRASSPVAKAYYFDIGASTYHTGGGGSSQDWIIDNYEARGINFSGIFAWEATPHSAQTVFAELPGRLHHIYHWYNFPASADANDDKNPLVILRRVATPEDFVVLKIDIDTPKVENALVQQLYDDKHLLSLVDEMFYEHHVNMTPMSTWWGEIPGLTLKDSFRIFLAFRRAGVRMHSWV